tara:strand:- start:1021 stop:1302 length:282 start_codon:yes stop_codon:yes gene_type:complete
MEFKLKSGKKIKLKDISVDERDELFDSIEYETNNKGEVKNVKMMYTTMTKWIRIGVDGDVTDEFLKSLKLEDKTEIFSKMQNYFLMGEAKASK